MRYAPGSSDFLVFSEFFFKNAYLVRHVLAGLLSLIVLFGWMISYFEQFSLSDGLYFAFITALTIGYGDIHAITATGRVLCILTGIVGMLFTGITVAVANRSLHETGVHQNALSEHE